MKNPRILAVGTANPPNAFTQEQVFHLAGYRSRSILKIFLNSDISRRHLHLDPWKSSCDGTSDELNQRYLEGAMHTGCLAVQRCLESAGMTPRDVDCFLVCSCTGYVCPDLATHLIGHMRFRSDVQRAPLLGLGCAGAVPTLQRSWDAARARPGRRALMLTVEICSACYFRDNTLETAVGNAICGDGAAALLLSTEALDATAHPEVVDFESFLDTSYLDKVGFEHKDGKLRIILAAEIRDIAAPMIEKALAPLLKRNSLSQQDIRFWVAHPGGRKVIDNVQATLGITDDQLRFSRRVLRDYGNMSSATVLFVLDEVVRHGEPRAGDWGVMLALGPGMAAEAALLRW